NDLHVGRTAQLALCKPADLDIGIPPLRFRGARAQHRYEANVAFAGPVEMTQHAPAELVLVALAGDWNDDTFCLRQAPANRSAQHGHVAFDIVDELFELR